MRAAIVTACGWNAALRSPAERRCVRMDSIWAGTYVVKVNRLDPNRDRTFGSNLSGRSSVLAMPMTARPAFFRPGHSKRL